MRRLVEIVFALCKFIPNVLIYGVFIVLQRILCVINNCLNKLCGSKRSLTPKRGAKLGTIIWRRRLFTYQASSPMDFLCVFYSTLYPDYVRRPNVTLYCITKDEAYFVETPENVNIYSSDENPFMYLAQYNRGKYIIKMPIETFPTLADNIGDPEVPLIWLSNIGRCGSTMLCQVFERVPGTFVMSEPDVTLNICEMETKNEISEKECEDMLRSVIRILCKPDPNIERFVVKTRSTCALLMMTLSKIYPKHVKQIFMYRNSLETIASYSIAATTYSILLRACADNEFISSILPIFRTQFRFERLCKLRTSPDIPLGNTFEQQVYMWANFMILGRNAIARDPSIIPQKYEDILLNPRKSINDIFQALGISLDNVDKALSSLDRDSQRGTSISGRKSRNSPRRRISTANMAVANRILSSYHLPHIGENFEL